MLLKTNAAKPGMEFNMGFGYHGKIAHIDLTTRKINIEEPEEVFYRKYMGGSAMGTYYLLKNSPAGCDPLSGENTLSFFTSVITGAPISGLSRITITAKSPTSNLIGDSQAGGFFPAEFKKTGFDGLVITGKSEKPVYIWITDGNIEIRSALHLIGKYTADVEDLIRRELDDIKIQVAQCGPAAEKGVLYAAVINNANRANGRTGMGAVMAAKNLKAVAVRGHLKINIHDQEKLSAITQKAVKSFPDSGLALLGKYGTARVVNLKNSFGYLPTNNWSSGYFKEAEKISGETLYDTVLKERDTCYGCVVRCKRVVEIHDGRFNVDPRYGGPEYETIGAFGSYCGISDLAAICYANQLCNMTGMDTISCGATIAWAMDCYEHGYLTKERLNGIDLHFGNADAMLEILKLIMEQKGIGKILGKGSQIAAKELGFGEELVVSVKNNEFPAHMPHDRRSLGLIYAVNPFGADHESSEHDPAYTVYSDDMASLGLYSPQSFDALNIEKVKYALYTQYFYSINDTLNCCNFVYGPVWHLIKPVEVPDIVNAITGWNTNLWELMQVGRRRLNLMRFFNAREGAGREQDTIPAKLHQSLEDGPTDGWKIDKGEIEKAIEQYYQMAGWDSDGNPKTITLDELGLGWVLKEKQMDE